jgi:hypothetical protein
MCCSNSSYKQPEIISHKISPYDTTLFLVINSIELRDLGLILGEQSGSHCLGVEEVARFLEKA